MIINSCLERTWFIIIIYFISKNGRVCYYSSSPRYSPPLLLSWTRLPRDKKKTPTLFVALKRRNEPSASFARTRAATSSFIRRFLFLVFFPSRRNPWPAPALKSSSSSWSRSPLLYCSWLSNKKKWYSSSSPCLHLLGGIKTIVATVCLLPHASLNEAAVRSTWKPNREAVVALFTFFVRTTPSRKRRTNEICPSLVINHG